MQESPEKLRTFIALDLSAAARTSLERIQEHLRQRGLSLAYTHLQDAHLTLVFLGDTTPETVDRLKPRLDEVAGGAAPFELALGHGGFFGPPRAPRIAWVGVAESPALMTLQRSLAEQVRAVGLPVESRPFHPHLTVARIKHRLPPDALTLIKSSINNTSFAGVPVDRVLFMRSQPNGAGPKYSVIHTAHLKGKDHHG